MTLILAALVLALRWTTFDVGFWNVDETIHAALARLLLDGGVLYRDAVDIRAPLSYYAFSGIFAVAGENNLAAVRALIAAMIAATAGFLLWTGARRASTSAGVGAGLLYAVLSSTALYPGDAYAAHTEWFLAFFTSAAAAVFLGAGNPPSSRRLLATGALLGAAFLSKQPALLDLAAPGAALLYLAWRSGQPLRATAIQLSFLVAGWVIPVGATAAWFAAHHALDEAVFYSWIYNLRYYGPEISTADRFLALQQPFKLLLALAPALVAAWAIGAGAAFLRACRAAPPGNDANATARVYVAVWTLTSLAGAASSGRTFEHYTIQFLPVFCLGAGMALAAFGARVAANQRWLMRLLAAAVLVVAVYEVGHSCLRLRGRAPFFDPTLKVSQYIREHSQPDERIFVWGFQSEIYLNADRRPASRFVIASFVTGLIPWTNVAPDRDTRYAIMPGSMEQLLADLERNQPRFIVDCSVGPNRHWDKYPPDNFPSFDAFIQQHYRQVEGHVFLHQGFRLYERRPEHEAAAAEPVASPETLATLAVGNLTPVRAVPAGMAPIRGEHADIFAHAPSSLTYALPAGVGAVSGSFGFLPGAYEDANAGPTDGAEFIIRWRPNGAPAQILLRRLLRPRQEAADRPFQPFQFALPPHAGGEIEFVIRPGPADNNASDWTVWRDFAFGSPAAAPAP